MNEIRTLRVNANTGLPNFSSRPSVLRPLLASEFLKAEMKRFAAMNSSGLSSRSVGTCPLYRQKFRNYERN